MANVKFYYGTKAKIDETSIEDGNLYIDIENNNLYVDIEGQRLSIGSVANLGTASQYNVDEDITEEAVSSNLPTTEAVKDYVKARIVGPEIIYSNTEPTDDSVKI